MNGPARLARLDEDGWELESAEARHAAHPDTFHIPPREARERLRPGQAVKLLFRIEAQYADGTPAVDVERMWAIVVRRSGDGYVGVLDNDPAGVEPDASLRAGIEFRFGPEHGADIHTPAREYVERRLNVFGTHL